MFSLISTMNSPRDIIGTLEPPSQFLSSFYVLLLMDDKFVQQNRLTNCLSYSLLKATMQQPPLLVSTLYPLLLAWSKSFGQPPCTFQCQ